MPPPPNRDRLTPGHELLLRAYLEHERSHTPTTTRRLADHCGWRSVNSVQRKRRALAFWGLLECVMQPGRLNFWRLTAEGRKLALGLELRDAQVVAAASQDAAEKENP